MPESLALVITPTVPGQEMISQVSPIYWEGSVQVRGDRSGRPVTGVGYVELTGYVAPRPTKR